MIVIVVIPDSNIFEAKHLKKTGCCTTMSNLSHPEDSSDLPKLTANMSTDLP